MNGIVLELQKEVLDETVSIESLLRKAYLIAKKLKFKEFEEWINQEQNGYNNALPEYRYINGEIKAWNPYHGWMPMILPQNINDIVSCISLDSSISAITDAYNSSNDGSVCLNITSTMTEFLNALIKGRPTKYAFFASKSELYRIMSTVRNKILGWTLILEENGILGENMTFTEKEKEVALNIPVINNYTNNFYNSVSNIDIQQGKGN